MVIGCSCPARSWSNTIIRLRIGLTERSTETGWALQDTADRVSVDSEGREGQEQSCGRSHSYYRCFYGTSYSTHPSQLLWVEVTATVIARGETQWTGARLPGNTSAAGQQSWRLPLSPIKEQRYNLNEDHYLHWRPLFRRKNPAAHKTTTEVPKGQTGDFGVKQKTRAIPEQKPLKRPHCTTDLRTIAWWQLNRANGADVWNLRKIVHYYLWCKLETGVIQMSTSWISPQKNRFQLSSQWECKILILAH